MGMKIGIIAVSGAVAEVTDAFTEIWSHLEVVASKSDFPRSDAAFAWKELHDEFVSAADWTPERPGKQVYLIWQDGPWTILWDSEFVLPVNEDEMAELSRRFGTAIGVIVVSVSGAAMLRYFEEGALRRSLDYCDGELHAEGEPLTAEAGIVNDAFYMDEAEQLCDALGIYALKESPPVETLTALCTIDRTDYRDQQPNSPAPVSSPRSSGQKPWWKFWY